MIKFSKLADYAVMILAVLAREGETRLMSASDISKATGLPDPTVAKILKSLTRSKILSSVRGAHGGYSLLKAIEEISIADIVLALDGSIALTACVEGSMQSCDYKAQCLVKGRWGIVNDAIYNALDVIKLSKILNAESLTVG